MRFTDIEEIPKKRLFKYKRGYAYLTGALLPLLTLNGGQSSIHNSNFPVNEEINVENKLENTLDLYVGYYKSTVSKDKLVKQDYSVVKPHPWEPSTQEFDIWKHDKQYNLEVHIKLFDIGIDDKPRKGLIFDVRNNKIYRITINSVGEYNVTSNDTFITNDMALNKFHETIFDFLEFKKENEIDRELKYWTPLEALENNALK